MTISMKFFSKIFRFKTKAYLEFVDLTEKIEKAAQESKIKNGLVHIFSPHTTAAIKIQEKEKGIFHDFQRVAEKIAPQKGYWEHNDLTKRTENLFCQSGPSDCLNGHSHMLALFLGASETLPLKAKKILLGTWQRIFLVELDCAREREVIVQVIGD